MDISTLLIVLILTFLAAFIVSRPFFTSEAKPDLPPENIFPVQPKHILAGQKEQHMGMIRELDADKLAGKVGPDDYTRLREEYLLETAVIQSKIEKIENEKKEVFQAEQEIERFCPGCGKKAARQDVYCSACGKKLDADRSA
jgi:hypothetical protein